MKIEKKHVIAVGLGVVSIALAGAYLQYKRLMNYCIGLKGIKVNKINADQADIDLSLSFQNKSDVKIDILSQEYAVYVNNKLITKASNKKPQIIIPVSTSVISVNIKFDPTQAGQNLLSAILAMGNTSIKIDIKLKIKLWLFTISIPYVYSTSIKELMTPSANPKPNTNCK